MRLKKTRWGVLVFSGVVLLAAAPGAFADAAPPLANNQGFSTLKAMLTKSCSDCHDWTGSWDTITGGSRIVPGDPDKSIIWQKVSTDEMPAAGDKLTAEQKEFIKAWILAGAPATDDPIALPSAAGVTTGAAATTTAAAAPASALRLPGKVVFHGVTGFTSAALFTAAGVLGVIHYIDMKNMIHPPGWNEDTAGENFSLMSSIWGANQPLRWWHVGFVISGEALYLGDAITGLSMLTKSTPGTLTNHDIHRYAFFTHASLMAAQIVLGFLETDALANGRHDEAMFYTGAHAVIGLAIPAVMVFAGVENILPQKQP
jgi:hypothetical protein